jgi:hypothetical protein
MELFLREGNTSEAFERPPAQVINETSQATPGLS